MRIHKFKINETLTVGIVFLIVSVCAILFYGKSFQKQDVAEAGIKDNGSYVKLPEVATSTNYSKDFKTYKDDKFKFSFKYPKDFSVEKLPMFEEDTTVRLVVRPASVKDADLDTVASLIISIAENDEGLTPEEWLLGPGGLDPSEDEYHKTTLAGQDAVYSDEGMWVALNTPDNKYRLSIADFSPEDSDRLYIEMGILLLSLSFKN